MNRDVYERLLATIADTNVPLLSSKSPSLAERQGPIVQWGPLGLLVDLYRADHPDLGHWEHDRQWNYDYLVAPDGHTITTCMLPPCVAQWAGTGTHPAVPGHGKLNSMFGRAPDRAGVLTLLKQVDPALIT